SAPKYIIDSHARITPFTCEGRTRLKDSHEIPPKASGVTNSVASTRPKRSTTVSQMIDERIQCRAARSGYENGRDRGGASPARGASTAALGALVPSIAGKAKVPKGRCCRR